MLILTPADADLVRGLTVPGHALAPKPLADGTLALPEACLNDPYHAARHAVLITLDIKPDSQIRPGTPSTPGDPNSPVIGSDWEQNATKVAACTYQSSWKAGQLVAVNLATL